MFNINKLYINKLCSSDGLTSDFVDHDNSVLTTTVTGSPVRGSVWRVELH